MKLDKPMVLTHAWRAVLIAAVAASVLFLGVQHGRARFGTSRPRWSGGPRVRVDVEFEPLEDSRLLRSYEVEFNGATTRFAQFRSSRPAREVIEQFEARYHRPEGEASAVEGPMVRIASGAYAVSGAVDGQGRTVGIVAFEDPQTGGSVYFVGRGRRPNAEGWRHGDAPGEEAPGIPRPLRSRRAFCIDGLGGIPSRLLVYEGWGAIDDTVELFATEMPKAGWRRNTDAERIIAQRVPGTFLSFLKGSKRAMIYIERDPRTSKVRTAVAYAEKSWLPPNRGL